MDLFLIWQFINIVFIDDLFINSLKLVSNSLKLDYMNKKILKT